MITKRKRVSCETKSLEFVSWFRKRVIALKVKPEKRDSIVIRDPATHFTYSV